MEGPVLGKLPIQSLEKTQEFLMPVPLVTLPDHAAFGGLKGREERGGTVALVVMGEGTRSTRLDRQARLSAVQGLNLALFVDTEDHRVLRRVRYTPTTSVSVSTNRGSRESLKLRVRWGLIR